MLISYQDFWKLTKVINSQNSEERYRPKNILLANFANREKVTMKDICEKVLELLTNVHPEITFIPHSYKFIEPSHFKLILKDQTYYSRIEYYWVEVQIIGAEVFITSYEGVMLYKFQVRDFNDETILFEES